jgi:dTDP-4-dehydrorhamnose reductase
VTIVVTGGRGQLGRSLARRGAAAGLDVVALGRDRLDVRDPAQVAARLDELGPAVVVNAAAFTAVDRAEDERALAFAVNAAGAGHVARVCAARGVALLQVSTDHVFDGAAARPYREDDPVAPRSVYGASKAAGGTQVGRAGAPRVGPARGLGDGPGFARAIVTAAALGRPLRVVADQRGSPTCVDDLADILFALAARPPGGIVHACGDGAATRHELAAAIAGEVARARGTSVAVVEPIATADAPGRAPRPAYAVLDTTRLRSLGIAPRPWRAGLATLVAALLAAPP